MTPHLRTFRTRTDGGRTLVTAAAVLWVTLAASITAAGQSSADVTVHEDRGTYTVTARFLVEQTPSAVLSVLTDYEQIPRFMPDIRTSLVLERGAGRAVVEQEAVSAFMMFSKRIHLVLEIDEQANDLRFRDRCRRSFVRYEGAWHLPWQDGHTAITYQLTAEPSFDVPGFMLSRLLKRDSGRMIEGLRREIAVRAASEWAPPLALYRGLRTMLAGYRALVADATLEVPPMPDSTVRPGDHYVGRALRRWLIALGDLPPDAQRLAQLRQGQLRVRQRPGPKNALGLVKFVFPNDQNVYMHGTPAPQLFGRPRPRRDFSHGCVRVEDPVRLAEWALDGQDGWTRDRIVAAMNGSRPQSITLARPIQVILFYVTAVVMPDDGTIRFADDIYGHDRRLDTALSQPDRRHPPVEEERQLLEHLTPHGR